MYRQGDRIQGYLSEVRQTTRGPQIIMSRGAPQYLEKLFEVEVPEIYDGIVEIMAAAREPGQRAKVAVFSKESTVDPVGACVGMKGSRVQTIVQELKGEKIDIVTWDEDITRFACNALAPAEISRVFLDEDNKEMEIVVPDNQLSLAIGKRGQNVRLAARLTGWKLDILSESNASAKTAESIFNLMLIPGMNETMAQNIFQSGFGSFQALADADMDDVLSIAGYEEEEKAQKLISDAQELVDKYAEEGMEIPQAPKAAVETKGDAKSQADARLKEELAALSKSEDTDSEPTSEAEGSEDSAEVEASADAPAESSEEASAEEAPSAEASESTDEENAEQ